jgi:outer membrane protein, multidrug efflux system
VAAGKRKHHHQKLQQRRKELAMTKLKLSIPLALLLVVAACKVGPNYKRPAVNVPDQYRNAPTLQGDQFGDMKWWAVFQDEELQKLVKEALANNYDIRIAATRIQQARANLGITRADQFPSLTASGGVINQRTPPDRADHTIDSAFIQMNYVVDFWGQYRRATEAARAQLLATEYAQDVVRLTLVSDVATSYFLLRAYDGQLLYAKATVDADKEMLKLNTVKFQGGESAKMDVYQAEVLVQTAEAQVIDLERLTNQTETALSVLLGRVPGPITRGLPLTDQPHMPVVPPGLPSSLVERRPDIKTAEQTLVSANANVGVAKAAFFPQFSLTGLFGAQSTALSSFLNGPATAWAAGGQVVQPVFQGGRIKSNYRLAWARRDEAELFYQKSVNKALGEVTDSLVGYQKAREYRIKIEEQTKTYSDAAKLSNVRFQGGVTSFLEVQYTEQQYFTSQLSLSIAWFNEMRAYVGLYQALGGGWQQQ